MTLKGLFDKNQMLVNCKEYSMRKRHKVEICVKLVKYEHLFLSFFYQY